MTFKFAFACAAALCLFATAAEASASYQFTINTSSLAGTTGFVELQLGDSGLLPFQDATATISNFQGGTLANIDPYTSTDPLYGAPDVMGDATGTLPGILTLDNDLRGSVVDYLHPITFGTSITFQVTLAGPAIDASDCAGFAFGNCAQHNFGVGLLSGDEDYLLTADTLDTYLVGGLTVSGNGTVTTYANPIPGTAVSALAITPVPEPAAWTVMLAGLGALGLAFRRRALV